VEVVRIGAKFLNPIENREIHTIFRQEPNPNCLSIQHPK
jgi:hypothetical protein